MSQSELIIQTSKEIYQSVAIASHLASKQNSNFKLHSLFRDKTLLLIGQEAEFKSGSKLKPLLVNWHWSGNRVRTSESCSRMQSKVLTAKSMAKLLGQLWHSLGVWDCKAQTQGISKQMTVAVACKWLTSGKSATTLANLQYYLSVKRFNVLYILCSESGQ